ncbi:MAG: SDR family oxidoreductase [Kibdelosporangium sp.]
MADLRFAQRTRLAELLTSARESHLESELDHGRTTEVVAELGRGGRVEEIAEIVLFLASGRAGYITGSTIAADGGFTAI